MKVFNSPQINQILKTYQKQVNKAEKAEPAAMAKDKIEISEEARDFQVAMKAFKDLPEVRQAKIDEIREQIKSGKYKPSADAVAEKMIQQVKGEEK